VRVNDTGHVQRCSDPCLPTATRVAVSRYDTVQPKHVCRSDRVNTTGNARARHPWAAGSRQHKA